MEVRPGYKQTEVGIIPEDWRVSRLGDMAETSSGTTPARAMQERYYRKGSIAWVKTMDLNNSDITSTSELVTETALKETCLRVYPVGTVLVAMYGGFQQIGRTGLLRIPATVNQAISAVKPNSTELVSEYLLATLNHRVDYWKSVASSSRKDPNISSQEIRNFPIAHTSPNEQRAIAEALGDVDSLLSRLERLITKKRDLKQAVMQQLLTGQTRLPGFNGKVEVVRLGDVADTDPENLNNDTTPSFCFNYISLEDVDEGALKSYSSQTFRTAPSRARRMLRKDDVLVSTVRPNLKSHLLFREAGQHWVCSTGFCVVRCRDKVTHPAYVFSQMFGYSVARQIEALLTGSNYPAINSGDVRDLQVPLPEYEEQAAIAKVLSDMDEELAALKGRHDKTRFLKQAMMQELLTGKTRLI